MHIQEVYVLEKMKVKLMKCAAYAYDSNTNSHNNVGISLSAPTLINYLSNISNSSFFAIIFINI